MGRDCGTLAKEQEANSLRSFRRLADKTTSGSSGTESNKGATDQFKELRKSKRVEERPCRVLKLLLKAVKTDKLIARRQVELALCRACQ